MILRVRARRAGLARRRAHVMSIDADEMAEPVRRERVSDVGGDHRVDVTGDKASRTEMREHRLPHEDVHVAPRHTGAHRLKYASLRVQNRLVDYSLVGGEGPADGEGTGDVRGVAHVLTTHVEKGHVRRRKLPIVGCARVPIVEHR